MWRYFAARLNGDGTESPLDNDLPLSGVTLTWTLSGPDALQATITPEMRRLKGADGLPLFLPWSTAIYAEIDGIIRHGTILESLKPVGSSLSLTGVGFTGYPKDLPYTGERSSVGVDPMNEARHIWAHIQAARSGNLGVVVDDATSPVRIGTVATDVEFTTGGGEDVAFEAGPYVLAWFQTDDLGAELDELAKGTPFDYRMEHDYTTTASESVPASISVGSYNLRGYDKATFVSRIPDLVAAMAGHSIIGLQEANESYQVSYQGSTVNELEAIVAALGGGWASLPAGTGYGVGIVYDTAVYRVLNHRVYPLGDSRALNLAELEELATGARFHFGNTHFAHNDGALRTSQAKQVIAIIRDLQWCVLTGDFNNYATFADSPRQLFNNAGLRGLRERRTDIVNAGYDSKRDTITSPWPLNGQWLDEVFTTALVEVTAGRLTPADGSDHAMLSADLTLAQTAVQRARFLSHFLRLGYPTLGRRLDDLRFVIGENVAEIPAVDFEGDDYADEVMVLGAGEGRKMIRATAVKPSGRLRRVAVVADKSQRSAASATSAASAEVAYRVGLPDVSDIAVRDHPHAPIGSWTVGDEIFLEGEAGWAGDIGLWVRIIEYSISPDTSDTARLTVVRTDKLGT